MFDNIIGKLGGLEAIAAQIGVTPEQMQALMAEISAKIGSGETSVAALAETAAEHGVSADKLQELLGTFGGDDLPAAGFGFGDAVIVELLKMTGKLPAIGRAACTAIVFPFDEELRDPANFEQFKREVAEAMVEGALDRSDADVAIAITGFAGPPGDDGPGGDDKVEGLVHLACQRRGGPLGALAGFEKSGHYFLAAPLGRGYDCGMRVAVEICKLMDRNADKSMSDLRKALPKTWSTPTMSPYAADTEKYDILERLVGKLVGMHEAGKGFAVVFPVFGF